jgi:hypothetical protein
MEERENDEELLREGKALAALLLEAEKEKDEGKVYAVEINNSSDNVADKKNSYDVVDVIPSLLKSIADPNKPMERLIFPVKTNASDDSTEDSTNPSISSSLNVSLNAADGTMDGKLLFGLEGVKSYEDILDFNEEGDYSDAVASSGEKEGLDGNDEKQEQPSAAQLMVKIQKMKKELKKSIFMSALPVLEKTDEDYCISTSEAVEKAIDEYTEQAASFATEAVEKVCSCRSPSFVEEEREKLDDAAAKDEEGDAAAVSIQKDDPKQSGALSLVAKLQQIHTDVKESFKTTREPVRTEALRAKNRKTVATCRHFTQPVVGS